MRFIKWMRFTDLPTIGEINEMVLVSENTSIIIYFNPKENRFYKREISYGFGDAPSTFYISDIDYPND